MRWRDFNPRRWWQWLLVVVVGLLALKEFYLRLKGTTGDFATFWWAGKLCLLGRNIYASVPGILPNVYAPLGALLMVPLALLPEKIAFIIWQIGQLWAIGASLLLLERFLEARDGKTHERFWLTLFLAFPALLSNWTYGQFNHLVLICIVVMLWFLKQGQEGIAGAALGLILSVKPFHLLPLLAWLLLKRCRKGVFGAVVVSFFGITVIPTLFWGWRGVIELLGDWWRQFTPHIFCVSWVSGSLVSTLYRLLTPCNVAGEINEKLFVNLISLPEWVVTGLVVILSVIAVSVTVWLCRYPLYETSPLQLLWETSWVLTVTLTLSTRTEKHHWVILLPAFFLLAHGILGLNIPKLSGKVGLAWFFYAIANSDLVPKVLRIFFRTAYWVHAAALLLVCFSLLSSLQGIKSHKDDSAKFNFTRCTTAHFAKMIREFYERLFQTRWW